MTQIVVTDPALAEQFRLSTPETEVVDSSGRLMGRFIPKEPLPQPPYNVESPYTIEQLEAFEKEEGGRSLAEIWQSLGQK